MSVLKSKKIQALQAQIKTSNLINKDKMQAIKGGGDGDGTGAQDKDVWN